MQETYLQITAFVTGALVMILEILGFRMFAPYFGYSVYVSGMLIGIVLVAMTIGAYLGGVWADKRPSFSFLFKLLLAADVYLFLIAFFYGSLLGWLSALGVLAGTFWASMIIFAPPMLLLGLVTPFIVKLIAKEHNIGLTVGKVTAVGTLGSIIGTFLVTFYLIPVLGTHITLYATSAVLLVVSVTALLFEHKAYGLFIGLIFLFNPIPVRSEGNIVFQTESAYNLVKVVSAGSRLYLKLNDDRWLQSSHSDSDTTGLYYDYLNLGPLLAKGKDILILGMAGGTSAMQFRNFFDANVEGVDIDPKVVEASHAYFNVPRDDPKLKIIVDDARPFLSKSDKKYDVIEVDMYQGGIYVPFYVVTQEFFQLVYTHLKEGGVMVMNVYSPTQYDAEARILQAV